MVVMGGAGGGKLTASGSGNDLPAALHWLYAVPFIGMACQSDAALLTGNNTAVECCS